MQNRHSSLCLCVTLILVSALSALAQSGSGNAPPATDRIQNSAQTEQPLLIARASGVLAAAALSDDSGLPDAPSAAQPEASASQPAPSPAPLKRSSQGAPPAALGGPLGVDHTVADRNYLMLTGGMFGASIANAELTLRCLNKHASCNDVPPSLQSRLGVYGVGIPADFGIAYLSYYMKKKHSHMWYVPTAVVAGANIFLAVRAYRFTGD